MSRLAETEFLGKVAANAIVHESVPWQDLKIRVCSECEQGNGTAAQRSGFPALGLEM